MGVFTKILVVVAMVLLSESRAWYAPEGQDDVADPLPSRGNRRLEEEDEFEVDTFPPRSGRAKVRTSSFTPKPATKVRSPTTAPPPRPGYDLPAPPRRVVNHLYDYPEFVSDAKPAPPIGQSYFGVELGSLSDPAETGSGQEVPTSFPPTVQESGATPAQDDSDEEAPISDATKRKKKTSSVGPSTDTSADTAAFLLQLVKMIRWPVVALILIAVLGSCLLSGCSVGLFGRQCFETNTHRQAPQIKGPRADQDISGDGLSLQTRRALSKGQEPKNLSVTFSAISKAQGGDAGDQGAKEHVRVVKETNL